jgi:hypothetical protein
MIVKLIKKYFFVILAVLIAIGGYLYVRAVGNEYTYVRSDYNSSSGIKNVYFDEESVGKAEVLSWEVTEKNLTVNLRSVAPGRFFICFDNSNGTGIAVFYAHKDGVITRDRFFGDCTGMRVVSILIIAYLFALCGYFMKKHEAQVRKSLYSYDNVLSLGLIIFVFFLMITQVRAMSFRNGINGAFYQAISSTQTFVVLTFPVVIVTTVFVTVSNITLMRKEGKTWRNLLAVILGLAIGIGALLPLIIGDYLQRSTIIDVHYERGVGRFIELFLENAISALVTYLECILIGTIVTAVKAAKHVPAFDKDYIIIHGCQIRKDGTLTKLLQSRADRAVEFANMQKEHTNKSIVFVPSGGKGSDEVISEGEAIKRYLLERGIGEDQILEETKSTTTEENFKFAKDLIRENFGSDGFKVAFSTTNYHVFRSGMLAESLGIKAEGIGSKTKRYFWINAFVREFIATIYEKKKTHIKVVGIMLLINIISVAMMYISEVVFF